MKQQESFYDSCLRGESVAVSRYYSRHYQTFSMYFHCHEAAEIMYVKTGSCQVQTEPFGSFALRPREFIFLDSYTRHRLVVHPQDGVNLLNLELLPTLSAPQDGQPDLCRLLRQSHVIDPGKEYPPVFTGYDEREIILNGIANTQQMLRGGFPPLMLYFQLYTLLYEILSQYSEARPAAPYFSACTRRALSFISEHLEEELSVAAIAKTAGVSASRLQHVFREETGMTLTEKIQEKRIEKAKALLRGSSMPIVDIAFEVGFGSRQHFTAVFKKFAACSPLHFRRNSPEV